MSSKLPQHLRRYVVDQNYERYTPKDQAVWRYILRQLVNFLRKNAHPFYLEGLEKTGIEIEQIPRIEDISAKLEKFGWRALPVSGFIPPAAFMELQAMSVLPIASDLRTIDHLLYTPAPDIVHEAAGHAPMLAHPEFAGYLKQYALVAKQAILSKQDLDLYEAIRELSDMKENPDSTSEQIENAQDKLDHVTKSVTYVSEAAELGRMNWWTAEYGLFGTTADPKIFGAGLLSSVGESRWCLSEKVQKIPLSVDCIRQSYDITEPQPQLFVASSFSVLSEVLEDMASQMAFRRGGISGLAKALKAKTVNTAVWSSGLEASGELSEILQSESGQPIYLRFLGPCQLAHQGTELPGQGTKYHAHGFGSPIGKVHGIDMDPALFGETELSKLNWIKGHWTEFAFDSGILVTGLVESLTFMDGRLCLVSLKNCEVKLGSRKLFLSEWGTYDMAVGMQIQSVFGGPADRVAYGETNDFVAARVPVRKISEQDALLYKAYTEVRDLRKNSNSSNDELTALCKKILRSFPREWLLLLELYELALQNRLKPDFCESLRGSLLSLAQKDEISELIHDGLGLAPLSNEELQRKG